MKPEAQRLPGLDSLRVLAALLVFLQHSLSCSHLDQWIDISGFRIGRIGTATFFLLAGYLASTSRRAPVLWFRERINMLFPAYWLVILCGFLFALIAHSKPFDAWQVVCQLSGIGYFTHGERIVNVATWFISPLLLLYLVAMLLRLTGRAQTVTLLLLLLTATGAILQSDPIGSVECHAITFLLAFLLGQQGLPQQQRLALLMAGLQLTVVLFQPEFRYGATALLMFALLLNQPRTFRISQWFSGIAYEWFLVHGLCVAVTVRLTDRWAAVFAVSALLSLLTAVVLKRIVSWLRSWPTVTSVVQQSACRTISCPDLLSDSP